VSIRGVKRAALGCASAAFTHGRDERYLQLWPRSRKKLHGSVHVMTAKKIDSAGLGVLVTKDRRWVQYARGILLEICSKADWYPAPRRWCMCAHSASAACRYADSRRIAEQAQCYSYIRSLSLVVLEVCIESSTRRHADRYTESVARARMSKGRQIPENAPETAESIQNEVGDHQALLLYPAEHGRCSRETACCNK